MKEQHLLLESFKRNGRVNQALLDALTPADFALSDGRGGWTVWTVEKHLRHMAGFRLGWLWNKSFQGCEEGRVRQHGVVVSNGF